MSDLIERAKGYEIKVHSERNIACAMADFAQFEALRIADELVALAMDSDDLAAALLEFVDGLRGKG